jgi:hypothetical protein
VPALQGLARGAGNRAVARLVGPLVREARFRSKVGADIVAKGQFLFHGKIFDQIWPKISAAISADAGVKEIWDSYQAALNPPEGRPKWAEADALRKELRDTKFPAELVGPDDARLEVGAQVFEKLWKDFVKPNASFPDLSPYMNLGHYQALMRWELIACRRTATLIAQRYVAAGGSGGTRSASTAIKPTQLIGSVKTDQKNYGGDRFRGTIATYSSELGKEVERMKRALDDGWVIHARVISGVAGGGKSFAEAEHSLIVYGYSGDTFEYYDPDVGGSNLQQTGFDRLYFDRQANRLSTAASEADIMVYGGHDESHEQGFHVGSGVHRYQVSSIETM